MTYRRITFLLLASGIGLTAMGCASIPCDEGCAREVVIIVPVTEPRPQPHPHHLAPEVPTATAPSRPESASTREDATATKTREHATDPSRNPPRAADAGSAAKRPRSR